MWLQRAAHVLTNKEEANAATVVEQYRALLEEVLTATGDADVAAWATHFYTVTMRYWRGLFHCYDVRDLPRTNNDLEQYFGTARHHERRATGHKRPSSGLVVRGAVRVVAAGATVLGVWTAQELRLANVDAWRELRKNLETRHENRRAARRFRRDPLTYLAQLEECLLYIDLPL